MAVIIALLGQAWGNTFGTLAVAWDVLAQISGITGTELQDVYKRQVPRGATMAVDTICAVDSITFSDATGAAMRSTMRSCVRSRCRRSPFSNRSAGLRRRTKYSRYNHKPMTNPKGRFGIHGGQYIPETLMNAVIELEAAYDHYKNDPDFNQELSELLNEYAGRPSRLYYAEKMTRDLGGAKIYLKREDLNHTGAHKINNVLGQALLARKMGKTRLIAETGAGQHGVATATAAALMGMECVVFMGEEDSVRQALNVYRMRLLGAEVIPVKTGTATLKDAVSEAMREWTSRIDDTHYCLGSVMGPHPFPTIAVSYTHLHRRGGADAGTRDSDPGRLPWTPGHLPGLRRGHYLLKAADARKTVHRHLRPAVSAF